MVYTYRLNTNTLSSVLDNANNTSGFNDFNKLGDDYTYDTNGNMITDKNKKINAIIYNHLNLPTKITFGATGNIVYIYNAAGQKLEKIVNSLLPTATVTTTNYLGGYQYQGVGTATPTLQFFPTAEGYVKNTVVNSTNNYSYVFNYTDHLGNVRLSYSDNITKDGIITSNEIVEENNYYPFGLKHKGYNANNLQPSYKYKYNGKELQDELGLNVYDYHNRTYDPATGRWLQMDPLAEQGRRWSPYTYAMDNPVYFIDPDGMWPFPSWAPIFAIAKAAVNSIATKVSNAYNNSKLARDVPRSYENSGIKKAVDAIPSFSKAKPDKPDRTSSNGIELTTPGGKTGAMAPPVTTGNTTKVGVEFILVLAEVFSPETTVPGAAPDGSNPFDRESDTGGTSSTMSTATSSEDAKVTMETTQQYVSGNSGVNNKNSIIAETRKDTIVKKGDQNKVRENDANEKKKAIQENNNNLK